MKIRLRIVLLCSMVLLSAGCLPGLGAQPTQAPTPVDLFPTIPPATAAPTVFVPPTLLPTAEVFTAVVPTILAPTPVGTAAGDVAGLPTATIVGMPAVTHPAEAPAPTVAATAAATPDPAHPEAIAILQPGPGSRVTSPLRVAGIAGPTFEQSLLASLVLADGTPLATLPTQIGADVGQRGPFALDLPFTTAVEQQAFLLVYAVSAKDGGTTHLASVGITLLPSGGAAEIRPAAERPEQIRIDSPAPGAVISGGWLRVEGFGLASFEQTLLVDLLDESGAIVHTVPVMVASSEMGVPGPFAADIPYAFGVETAARVQVRDVSPAYGGNSHLTSVEVRLLP